MSTDKPRRRYHYSVRNGNGSIILHFGPNYRAAHEFAKRSDVVGLKYNLTVCKYLVSGEDETELGDGGSNNGAR